MRIYDTLVFTVEALRNVLSLVTNSKSFEHCGQFSPRNVCHRGRRSSLAIFLTKCFLL